MVPKDNPNIVNVWIYLKYKLTVLKSIKYPVNFQFFWGFRE